MQYIKIVDGKVSEHLSTNEKLDGYIEAPEFNGYIGIESNHLDESYKMKSDEVLISEGIITDNRGVYYDTETKERYEIKNLHVDPKETWTKLEPKQFDEWIVDKWVENADKKAAYEKAVKIAEAQAYLNSTDFYFTVDKYSQLTDEKKIELETEREAKRQVIRDTLGENK